MGTLQAEESGFAPIYDEMLGLAYMDAFPGQAQQWGDRGTTGGGGTTDAGNTLAPGGVDAVDVLAAGSAGDLSETETLYDSPPNAPGGTGQRLEGTRLQTRPAGARGGAPSDNVYMDSNGTRFTQATVDAIEANIPPGWSEYNPGAVWGVLGYIDFAARQGWVFDEDGKAAPAVAAERPAAVHPSRR